MMKISAPIDEVQVVDCVGIRSVNFVSELLIRIWTWVLAQT